MARDPNPARAGPVNSATQQQGGAFIAAPPHPPPAATCIACYHSTLSILHDTHLFSALSVFQASDNSSELMRYTAQSFSNRSISKLHAQVCKL